MVTLYEPKPVQIGADGICTDVGSGERARIVRAVHIPQHGGEQSLNTGECGLGTVCSWWQR